MAEVVRDFMGNMVCSGKKNVGTYNPYHNSNLYNILCGLSRQDNSWDYVVLPKNKIRSLDVKHGYSEMPMWEIESINPFLIREEDLEKVFPKQDRKEENKMADARKILNIYEDIEIVKIRKKYDEKCEKVESESVESKIAKKVREYAQKELKKAFPNYDESKESIITVTFNITDETRTKIEELHKERRKEQKELDEKIQEINAILEIAETFEQKMQTLLAYDVVDNKGVMKK